MLNFQLDEKTLILFLILFINIVDKDYEKLFDNLKKLLKDDGVILINKHYSNKNLSGLPFYKFFRMKLTNIKKFFF